MHNNQSANQCAAKSCSFTCTFLCSEKALTTVTQSHQKAKAYPKNNPSLQRVDSRVQHIWRLRVIGSCFDEGLKLKMSASLSLYGENLTLITSYSIILQSGQFVLY